MDKQLKQFYTDEYVREAVFAFLMDCVNQKAIERVMDRKDTTGIADAKEIIREAFIALKESYGETPKPVAQTSR